MGLPDLTRRRLLIEAVPQQEYDPEEHYISVQLSDKSRRRLLSHVSPAHPNLQASHVTLVAQPTEDDIARFRKFVGRQVNFHATHHANDPKMGVQAVRIHGRDLDKYSNKEHKHVTISTKPRVSAAASNALLARTRGEEFPNSKWVPLTGTIEITRRLGRP